MRNPSILRLAVVAVIALGLAGAASAADDCDCTTSVVGPKDGVHTAGLANDTTVHAVLWPPNHKSKTVTISASGSNGECNVEIKGVTQDEAIDAPGSGNTTGFDAENCSNDSNASSVDLRAERSGTGNGRTYDIDYTVTEPLLSGGSTCSRDVIAIVPHDQRVNQSYTTEDALLPSGVVCAPGGM